MKIHTVTRYLLVLLLLLPALFTACTAEDSLIDEQSNRVLPEGTPFEVTFGGWANGMSVAEVSTRAAGDDPNQITNLRLLVFDENHNFLYSREAVLGSIVADDKTDGEHIPSGRDGITKMWQFTVSLISSNKKRYIHFIANHDWNGFPQDYFIEGKSDGELISGLTTNKVEFWRMAEFNQLQEADMNGKVFKLLRNNAKVSLHFGGDASKFVYEGFTVYNTPNKATVAPFIFNEDMSYKFPITPDKPTIPAEANPLFPGAIGKYDNGYDIFEQTNKSDYTGFVIMQGKYNGSATSSYYKIDLKYLVESTGVASLYEIVRNTHYIITVTEVLNKGYATRKEAVNNPAGNNIFASLEYADYPSVSDGTSSLEVEKLGGTFVVLPNTFTTNVKYTEGIKNVTYYPSWQPEDPYLGDIVRTDDPLDPTKGTLSVNFKKIPDDRTLNYSINVIGKHPTTGALIARKITLTLRPPYNFNQGISSTGVAAGDKVTIKFDVPATINKSSFPFDVFIETKELTPDLSDGYNNGMMLVQKDGKYYYKYTVKESAAAGTTIKLNFIRNQADATEVINLTSPYYNPAIVNLGDFDATRGILRIGSAITTALMPVNADLKIVYNGTEYDGDTNTMGIIVAMIGDQPGNYRIRVLKDLITDHSKPLTIRYRFTTPNPNGSVAYVMEKTQTIQQWLDSPNQTLTPVSIIIKGYISSVWAGTAYSVDNNAAMLKVNKGTLSNVTNKDSSKSNFTLTLTGADTQIQSVIFDYDDHADPTDPNNDHYRIDVTIQNLGSDSYVRMPAI